MRLIEISLAGLNDVDEISKLHFTAYKEKFNLSYISNNLDDYVTSTLLDINTRKVYILKYNLTIIGILVAEDRTDILLKNSCYHLITRIFISKEYRHRGLAKSMIKSVQNLIGPLMGWNGKFYKIKDIT